MLCAISDFPDETSSSPSVPQPDSDTVLADPLPGPRAICTIPRDNTAAARVTKLKPTAIQRRPNRWPCHSGVGVGVAIGTGESKGERCIRIGGWSEGEAVVHTEMRLSEKV